MMDLDDAGSLSARSTSSVEDGSISSRSKKSKTLARLRKLKRVEGAVTPPDGISPRPPSHGFGEENNNASGPSPPIGLVNGYTEPRRPEVNVPKPDVLGTEFNSRNFKIDDGGNSSGLNSLGDPLDIGARRPMPKPLFASPLDPVRPSMRGLGGLEPLALRKVPEPLDGAGIAESRFETKRMLWDGGGAGTDDDRRDIEPAKKEEPGVLSMEKDGKDNVSSVEEVIRIRGAVESESNDAHESNLLPENSLSHVVRHREISELSEDTVGRDVVEDRKHISRTLQDVDDGIDIGSNDSLDILPDNAGPRTRGVGVKLAVAAALKEELTQQDNNSDDTSHRPAEIVSLRPKLEDAIDSHETSLIEVRNVVQEDRAHPVINVIDEDSDDDDDDDDDLIMASTPSHSSTVEMENLTNSLKLEQGTLKDMLSNHEVEDERTEESEEENRSGDIVERSRDPTSKSESDDENNDANDDDEDEERLKKYLALKLREVEEEDERSKEASSSSGSLSRVGRLSPITTTGALPPIPANFSSPALRTAYKRDDADDSIVDSEISDATETNRSFSSTAMLLQTLTNKGARRGNRSYLSGGVRNTGSLVGKEELDSHLPDRKLKIFVATWNMHEDKEIPENLDDLLLPDDCEYMQDMYVIGSQESCPDISEWEIRLQETLGPTHVLLHSATHGVLHCAIFLRRDLIWFCSPVEECRVSTRPGSMVKTKGAMAVSFNFFGTSFIFIVSHFTSGDENMKDRIQDYEKTLKGITLPEKVPPTRKFNILTSDFTTRFDCVFWCGDFNCRLAENKARVEGWIQQLRTGNREDNEVLLQHDQLIKHMKKNEIFKGFQEGSIRFLPSYKFDLGEDVYDTSAKARVPSYTDRVLYKSRKASDITLTHYSSCDEIKTSDHRPVYALFQASIRPGKDNTMTGGGMFSRDVFIEGNKRRGAKAGMPKRTQNSSAVCSVM